MDNLYVGNLSYDATEDDIRAIFEEFGEVKSVKIIMDRDTGKSKGFGFVEMENGNLAIEGLNGNEFMGRELKISVARPRENSRNRGNSYGR